MSDRSITPLPPADFTPEMGGYKTLQPFRYWCQKVLPLVYDDSLSYYELLCKVVDYLNKTMEDVETLHGDVTNLHNAYVKLQSYVNNYFSTLDVQQEINKKLDELFSSGELDNLFVLYSKRTNIHKISFSVNYDDVLKVTSVDNIKDVIKNYYLSGCSNIILTIHIQKDMSGFKEDINFLTNLKNACTLYGIKCDTVKLHYTGTLDTSNTDMYIEKIGECFTLCNSAGFTFERMVLLNERDTILLNDDYNNFIINCVSKAKQYVNNVGVSFQTILNMNNALHRHYANVNKFDFIGLNIYPPCGNGVTCTQTDIIENFSSQINMFSQIVTQYSGIKFIISEIGTLGSIQNLQAPSYYTITGSVVTPLLCQYYHEAFKYPTPEVWAWYMEIATNVQEFRDFIRNEVL